MRYFLILSLFIMQLCAGQYDKVKITPEISYMYVYHKGKAVKIHRIQDTKHKLTGEYARQYRPNTEIQPIKMRSDIPTIGEVELLSFLQKKVNTGEGVLIDIREKSDYLRGTIPSSVNIPYETIYDNTKMKKILHILGMIKAPSGELDSNKVMSVAVFCDGLWCGTAPKFIENLLALGYPKDKIYYYRGGMQMWKILGFTTVGN